MLTKSLSLIILAVAGICAKPVDRVPDDTTIIDKLTSTSTDASVENTKVTTTVKPGPFSWILAPLSQSVQFSPQSFLQDRIVQLKEALNNLGLQVRQDVKSKQLNSASGLLHIAGINDSGFYTNRLEPAGLLGGNGWFANKGGILGGPGAIVSMGSILTDYPTPYKKK